MDNNKPTTPVTPVPQPVSPIAQPVQSPVVSGSHNKMIMWLVGGLIVGILVIGGVYLLISNKQTKQPQQITNVPSQTPKASPQENLDQQLNVIDVASPDLDFASIDSDLQNL